MREVKQVKYQITIQLDTENGNPSKWDWVELLDETNLLVDVKEIREVKQ